MGRGKNGEKTHTVLSAQETVEDLFHYDRVEFNELGQSLDDFILHEKNKQNDT